jgi:hypothetical protein
VNVTQVSLVLEIDGKTCAAVLSEVDKNLLVKLVASLVPDGLLKVIPLNSDFKWEQFKSQDYAKTEEKNHEG